MIYKVNDVIISFIKCLEVTMLGTRFDHKLQQWVVFLKSTGKIISKHGTEEEAKQALRTLRLNGDEETLSRRIRY